MMTNRAASRRAKSRMPARHMPRHAADGGATQTPGRVGRRLSEEKTAREQAGQKNLFQLRVLSDLCAGTRRGPVHPTERTQFDLDPRDPGQGSGGGLPPALAGAIIAGGGPPTGMPVGARAACSA